jgi:Wiskott-Aldrich syndrome protein
MPVPPPPPPPPPPSFGGPPPPPPPMMMMGGGPPPPPAPALNLGTGDRSDLLKSIADFGNKPKLKKVDPSQIKDRSTPIVGAGAVGGSGAGGSNNNSASSSAAASDSNVPKSNDLRLIMRSNSWCL